MINLLSHFFIKKVAKDYNAIAESFSGTRDSHWKEWQLIKEHFKKSHLMLDIGCGNGRAADFFTYKEYVGVDISSELIKIAQKSNSKKNVSFKVANILKLSNTLTNNTFDRVLSIAMFHHLPSKKARLEALHEVRKVMKKDGYFIFSVWNLKYGKRYKKERQIALIKSILTLGILSKGDLSIKWKKGSNKVSRYYYAFNVKELSSLIKKSGLELTEVLPVKNGQKTEVKEAHNIYFICKN